MSRKKPGNGSQKFGLKIDMAHIIWVSVAKLFHIFMVSDSDGKQIRKTFGIGIVRILDLVNHSEDTHMMNNILPTLYLQHLIV